MKLSNEFSRERNLLVINSFLMYLSFFNFNFISHIQFLNIDSSSFTIEDTLAVLLLLNTYFLFRVIIEWFKSSLDSRHSNSNKIDFYTSLTIGIIAIICIIYKLTSGYWVWNFPKIPLIMLLVIGEFIALFSTSSIQNIVFIRTKKQSNKLGLSRIPYAVKIELYMTISIILLILPVTWAGVYYLANEQVNLYWYIIVIIPFVIHSIALIPYFLFPDNEKINSLQKIFDQHEIAKKIELSRINITKNEFEMFCKPVNDDEYKNLLNQLSNGFNPNKIMQNGWTPFLLSVANGDMRLAKKFIEYGADINTKNTLGRSALHFAIRYDFLDFVKLLIDNNVNVNQNEDFGNANHPIIEATIKGNINIVEILIEAGANIDVKDLKKKNALQYAEDNNFGEIAKILRKMKNSKK